MYFNLHSHKSVCTKKNRKEIKQAKMTNIKRVRSLFCKGKTWDDGDSDADGMQEENNC